MSISIQADDGPPPGGVRKALGLRANQRAVRVTGDVASELCDLASLQNDFELTRSFLEAYFELPEDALRADSSEQALWIAAFTIYGRAFANGNRHAAKPRTDVYSSDELEIHRFVVETRNKYIAHSVNAFEEAAAFAIVDDTFATLSALSVGTQHTSLRSLRPDRARSIADMCQVQIASLNLRIRDAEDRLLSEVRQRDPEDVRNLPDLTNATIDQGAVSRSRTARNIN